MFRLAHLSDLHISPLPRIRRLDLMSKRVLGYANWTRNRGKRTADWVLASLLADLDRKAPDHVAVTGDLVNLALAEEFDTAGNVLRAIGSPDAVSVVPGNHDAYVPGAAGRAALCWDAFMRGDAPESGHPLDEHRFPYVRKRGPIALIGVSTATATGPFMATGEVRRKQRKRLAAALQATRGAFRIVLIHHPPVSGATPWHKRLIKAGKIRAILEEHGAELVLHGHTHLPTRRLLTGPQGPIPVVGVAAAGEAPGSHRPPAQYNLFEISGEAGRWSCTLTAHVCEGPDLVAQRPVLPIYENGVCVAPDDAQDAPVEGPIVTQP